MGKIVIKRKVSLSFLGEQYSEAYINFRTIPVKDYIELEEKMPKQDDTNTSNKTFVPMVIELLKKYFSDGKFPDETGELVDLDADDIDDLDSETTITCFNVLVGQANDPKDLNQ